MEHKKIAFIGAGNMVKAIVSGLVADGYPAELITATAPSETRRLPLEQDYGIQTTSDNLFAAHKLTWWCCQLNLKWWKRSADHYKTSTLQVS